MGCERLRFSEIGLDLGLRSLAVIWRFRVPIWQLVPARRRRRLVVMIWISRVLELEANEVAGYDIENDENRTEIQEASPAAWNVIFREQRLQIIELWDVCHVSIIHRTQFYLLFKGDPADQIYMEVELRRLTWLQQHLAELGNASPARFGNEPTIS
ncbi:hypothetical protein RHMOL_Rhmol01G0160600 [Rhododendron molle]|uniref:Uncharacterized protein n=1 Tax=Rhododendron molle TaxID=49168 RepID=A0ACC0Q3K5_RHOML|nr:hypothetical protein RHMOL_Rhmol01G0160600 [Rhododendron molle]